MLPLAVDCSIAFVLDNLPSLPVGSDGGANLLQLLLWFEDLGKLPRGIDQNVAFVYRVYRTLSGRGWTTANVGTDFGL